MSNGALPCCLDAERALLGAILLRPEALEGLTISAADFHHPREARWFRAEGQI